MIESDTVEATGNSLNSTLDNSPRHPPTRIRVDALDATRLEAQGARSAVIKLDIKLRT